MDTQQHGVVLDDGTKIPFSQLQQTDPLLYKQYTEGVAQPQASLQQTQASTGLTATEQQQQALQLQKNSALNQISSEMNQSKGKGQFIDPHTYNHLKNTKPGLVSDDEFDSSFGQFTDPSKQYLYNTGAGRVLQVQRGIVTTKIASQVNKILQQYTDLPHTGPAEGAAIQSPLYKMLGFGGSQLTYENNKNAIASNITGGIDISKLPSLGLNASDIAQVTANLPSVGDNQGQVQSKLKNLNQIVSGMTGQGIDSKVLEKAGIKQDLGIGDVASVGKDLLSSLLSKATNVAQDVGTGIRNKVEQPQLQKQMSQAQQYENEASGTNNAALKKILLGDANNIRSGVANESQDIRKSFSPDVNQNPIMRSILGAGDVAGAAGIPSMVSGGASALGNMLAGGGKTNIAGDVLKSMVTLGRSGGKKAAGEAIETAAGKGAQINWDDIANAANERASNLGTRVQKELQQLLMDEKPVPGSPGEIANPKISSAQALQLRIGLGQRLPSGFYPTELQKIFGGGGSVVPRNKAVGILRDTVSSALKEAAPDIKNPDALYSFYSKIHGDAPTWAKRVLVGTVADQFAKKLPTPARGLADIIPALLAVH